MRLPRHRVRTLLIAIGVVAVLLGARHEYCACNRSIVTSLGPSSRPLACPAARTAPSCRRGRAAASPGLPLADKHCRCSGERGFSVPIAITFMVFSFVLHGLPEHLEVHVLVLDALRQHPAQDLHGFLVRELDRAVKRIDLAAVLRDLRGCRRSRGPDPPPRSRRACRSRTARGEDRL